MTELEAVEALKALIEMAEGVEDDYADDSDGYIDTWQSQKWIEQIKRGKQALAVLEKGFTKRAGRA